jgi:hypothetical protein
MVRMYRGNFQAVSNSARHASLVDQTLSFAIELDKIVEIIEIICISVNLC